MYCNIIGEKLVTFLALSYSNCESHLAKTRAFFKNSNPGMTSCAKLTSAKWLSLYTYVKTRRYLQIAHNLSAWELKKSTSFSPLFLLVWSCFFFPMLGIEREVDLSFFNFLIIDSLFPLCFFIMLISFGLFISGYLFFISSSISIAIWKKKKFTIRVFFLLEGEQKKVPWRF